MRKGKGEKVIKSKRWKSEWTREEQRRKGGTPAPRRVQYATMNKAINIADFNITRSVTDDWCDLENSVFDSAPLSENMTSSTKPEGHNILHCCQRMTKLRQQVTCTENSVKFGRAVLKTCKQTDTHIQTDQHTDTLITILCTHPEGKVTTF